MPPRIVQESDGVGKIRAFKLPREMVHADDERRSLKGLQSLDDRLKSLLYLSPDLRPGAR